MTERPKIKCIALRQCQTRNISGAIQFYEEGEYGFFYEVPKHFVRADKIDSSSADLSRISEHVLRQSEGITTEAMTQYYKEVYGEDISGYPRDKVIDLLVYARNNPKELLSAKATAPMAHEFKAPAQNSGNTSGINVAFAKEETKIEVPPAEEKDELDELLSGGK